MEILAGMCAGDSTFRKSSDVTQRVAYGVRVVVDAYGANTKIANVKRLVVDAELARQIEAHLKAKEKEIVGPIPSWRTIWTMLQNMPASRNRSLEVRIHKIIRLDLVKLHNQTFILTGNFSDPPKLHKELG